jgi:hypothetical protein
MHKENLNQKEGFDRPVDGRRSSELVTPTHEALASWGPEGKRDEWVDERKGATTELTV